MKNKDEWISAAEAVAILRPTLSPIDAQLRICQRAHAGIVRARAEHFHEGKRRFQDCDIPEAFWWAEGQDALRQNWVAGDFSTWIDHRIELRAFGVMFARADIQKILPAAVLAKEETLPPPSRGANPGQSRRLTTIVALDVAGYSVGTQANEPKMIGDVAVLRHLIDAIAQRHGGRIFNSAGDGFMLEFGSSVAGVEAAIELAEKCRPSVRVGVHLGDVVVQTNGDLLGHGVNVAARVMAQATAGSVLVSADVVRTIHGPIAQSLRSVGVRKLDKMDETLEVFAPAQQDAGVVAGRSRQHGSSASDIDQIQRDIFWLSENLLSYKPYDSLEAEARLRYSRLDNSDSRLWLNPNLNQMRRDFINRCGIVLDERRRGGFPDRVTRSEVATLGTGLLAFIEE